MLTKTNNAGYKFYYTAADSAGLTTANMITHPVKEPNAKHSTLIYTLFKKGLQTAVDQAHITFELKVIPPNNASNSSVTTTQKHLTLLLKYKNDYISAAMIADENDDPNNGHIVIKEDKYEFVITGASGRFKNCKYLSITFDNAGISNFSQGRKYARIIVIK